MLIDLVKIGACIVAIGMMLTLVAGFTVLPMMANYRECGTIFLCANQH